MKYKQNGGTQNDLINAINKNDLEMVKFLVEKGADINSPNKLGHIPLNYSIQQGNFDIAKFLIEKGANINVKNNIGQTPLIIAILFSKSKFVDLLVEKGADINAKDNIEQTPLIIAISKNDLEMVKFLLEKGADINVKDKLGQIPLNHSMRQGKYDIVKFLIEKGADINAKDNLEQTPLIIAFLKGNFGIAKFLIEKGADINAKDKLGKTPLNYSIQQGNFNIAKFLIEKGANLDIQDKNGKTALIMTIRDSFLKIAELLVENGANLDLQDKDGKTALMMSIEANLSPSDRLKIVKFLISKGANVDIQDKNGKTALMIADKKGYSQIVKIIDGDNFLLENINSVCDASKLKEKELIKIAKNLQLNDVSKDNICEQIKTFFKEQSKNNTKNIDQCKNDSDLLGTDLKDVHPIFFYTIKENNNLFCGDIRQLIRLDKNPWTRTPFTIEEQNNMTKEYEKIVTLIRNIEDDEEEEVINETIETRINRAMSSVLHELRYPVDVQQYVEADEEKLNRFINDLRVENVLTQTEKSNLHKLDKLPNKKEALAKLLKLILDNDNTYIISGGHKVSALRVGLEQVYNNIFSLELE